MITNLMKLADQLANDAIENGGATLTISDAAPVLNGYCIGGGLLKTDDALATMPATDNKKALAAKIYLELILAAEELKGFTAVGVWNSNGVIYLDAVTVESKFIKAVITGYQRKQQAIGSLIAGTYEEIPLKEI